MRIMRKSKFLSTAARASKTSKARVNALRQEWINGIDISASFSNRPQPKIYKLANARQTKLRVSFPYTGEKIERHIAADTFAETIQKIGIDKVRELRLRGNGVPLIDSVPRDDGKSVQPKIQGWYICIYSGTSKKKEQLERIAQQLGIRLKVEIISKDKSALF